MKKRVATLTKRRQILLERIETQRMDVADISQNFQKPIAFADTGLKAVRYMQNHPGFIAGGLVALLSLRGKRIASVAQKVWRLTYLYPAIFSFGLKYFSHASRSPSAEELSDGHPEVCDSEADN
jgi:hypothetical protein